MKKEKEKKGKGKGKGKGKEKNLGETAREHRRIGAEREREEGVPVEEEREGEEGRREED